MANVDLNYDGPIVTPKEAKAKGLKRYFSGSRCRNGHIAERNLSGGCLACCRLWTAKWRELNSEYLRSYDKSEEIKKRKRDLRSTRRDEINARVRERRALFPEIAQRERESKRRHKEKYKDQIMARSKEKWANPEYRIAELKKQQEKRNAKLEKRSGRKKPSVCDICCGTHHRGIVYDHCHEYGHFRGWICDRCNKVLGLIKDSPALLRKMAKYLERTDGSTNGKTEELTPIERLCGAIEIVPDSK